MKKYAQRLRSSIVGLLLFSGSYVQAQPGLLFLNKSPSKIDSIVLYTNEDRKILQAIDTGCTVPFDIAFEWSNKHGVFVCDYKIYFKEKYFKGQILKAISNNKIFIEKDFNTHSRFTIFVNNISSFPIDRIMPTNCLIDSSYEVSPRVRAIEVNYLKFLKEPKVEITTNGKSHLIDLSKHDFANLSDLTASMWISDSAVLPGIIPFENMKEFTVVLQPASLKIDLECITIKSTAFINSYAFADSKIKVLIFDFDRLRKKPSFIIRKKGKRLKVKLSGRDLSEVYYGRKYFWVFDKRVKDQF